MAVAFDTLLDHHVILAGVRDADGAVVDLEFRLVNQAARLSSKPSGGALVGRRMMELLDDQVAAELLATYTGVLESGEPLVLDGYCYPSTAGSPARYLDIRAVRMGELVSITWRDVSERTRLAEHYKLLAENSLDVVVLTGSDAVIRWISPSVELLTGWRPEDMVGCNFFDFILDTGQSRRHEYRNHTWEAPVFLTIQMLVRGGGLRWCTASVRQVQDEQTGEWVRVSSLHDIQAEVEATQALEESERLYRLLAENASDIVATGSDDGICTWMSPSVSGILGWDPAELVGHSLEEFAHPDAKAALVVALAQLGREAVEVGQASLREPMLVQGIDGEYHWFDVVVRRVFDPLRGAWMLIASWRVVDQVVSARQAQQRSEEAYQQLAGKIPDVVLWADELGVIGWVSESVEAGLGWSAEELRGKCVDELVVSKDRGMVREILSRCRSGEVVPACSLGVIQSQGGSRPTCLRAAVVGGEAGGIGVVVSLVDEDAGRVGQ